MAALSVNMWHVSVPYIREMGVCREEEQELRGFMG